MIRRFIIELGNIPVEINFNVDRYPIAHFDHFRPFISSNYPCFVLNISSNGEYWDIPQVDPTPISTTFSNNNATNFFFCGKYIGNISMNALRAEFFIPRTSSRTEVNFVISIDSILRILFTSIAPFFDALFFHAASVEYQSRGFVFIGPSGSGKSTIARSVPYGNVFSDELSLIRASGKNFSVFGTPFSGTYEYEAINKKAELSDIFIINKSENNSIKTISKRMAYIFLLKNIVYFGNDIATMVKIIPIVNRVINTFQTKLLEFSRKCTFWKYLDKL